MSTRAPKSSWQHICRTATAILLTVSFLGLLIAVTAFGIFTDNREMLANVLKILTYGIMFSCAWAGGTSWLNRHHTKSKTFREAVKDLVTDSVLSDVEPPKKG